MGLIDELEGLPTQTSANFKLTPLTNQPHSQPINSTRTTPRGAAQLIGIERLISHLLRTLDRTVSPVLDYSFFGSLFPGALVVSSSAALRFLALPGLRLEDLSLGTYALATQSAARGQS